MASFSMDNRVYSVVLGPTRVQEPEKIVDFSSFSLQELLETYAISKSSMTEYGFSVEELEIQQSVLQELSNRINATGKEV